MFSDITLQELFARKKEEEHTLIDVRSPKEFHEATIPGSINIPVFTDEERAEVGTLYKQAGKETARERGLEIVSAKLPDFIAEVKAIKTPKTVFCWRGGMRSKTAATVVDLMGVDVNRLTGGIRSYRQWVVSELDKKGFKPDLVVLNGYTGSGKTAILKQLSRDGYPVMDLEKMANHRGSIFGHIGLEPSNQKKFESQLVQKMLQYQDAPFVFIEGESKRIGKAMLPEFFYEKKEHSTQLFVNLPIEERVKNILDDYEPWNHPEKFMEAFQVIKKRIHTPVAKEIQTDLQSGNYSNAVKLLLEYYYDPRYEHTISKFPDDKKITVNADNTDEAVEEIKNFKGIQVLESK
ncbi:tRNA 2-selenouridine(34) synthase MnmH [Virgibacillus doumboii]|uniref:tRNA 2-selenouridine(34) synthase MnmH n=1 Tax=Virgibacillus doumboii TaxID=2697503 RepID=UPI0013E0B1F0|nr:tRNA 2-selenouridine(34) synthase MnmH [Virgibacillus doumboii]